MPERGRGLEDRSHAATPLFPASIRRSRGDGTRLAGIGGNSRGSSSNRSSTEPARLAAGSPGAGPGVEEYAIARNQAETDVQAYQELSSTFDRVRQDASRVGSFLAGHEEDRLAANQHYQAAENALNQVQSETAGSSGEWARWLEQIRGAAADLAHAERLAQEDIRLARQAEAEIQEAGSARSARPEPISRWALRSTRMRRRGPGVAGRAALPVAELRAGHPHGRAAIQQVRQAHTVAVQQAHWRQMQVDAERRR